MQTHIVWAVAATLVCTGPAIGQVDWNTAGNNGLNSNSSFLGTTDGVPINFRTNNVLRMKLTETLVNQNWAWYQQNNLDFSGHLGIGSPTPQRPLTYLHLNSAGLTGITVGYRPWMRVGVFST